MKTSQPFLAVLGAFAGLALSAPAQSHSEAGRSDTVVTPNSKDMPPEPARPVTPRTTDDAVTTPRATDTITTSPKVDATADSTATINRAPTADEALRFTNLDKDNDGRISRSEFTLASPQLQTGVDESSRTETKQIGNRTAVDSEAAATTDSRVTSASSSVELFNQLDTNKDGFLSHAELDAQQGAKVDVTK